MDWGGQLIIWWNVKALASELHRADEIRLPNWVHVVVGRNDYILWTMWGYVPQSLVFLRLKSFLFCVLLQLIILQLFFFYFSYSFSLLNVRHCGVAIKPKHVDVVLLVIKQYWNFRLNIEQTFQFHNNENCTGFMIAPNWLLANSNQS